MASALQNFFDVILRGESKTYNDHNWYVCNGKSCLRGYIEGNPKNPTRYSLLKKPLSQYTIGEVQEFQSHPRDSVGQLWATGRYQIIPKTLNGLVSSLGLKKTDVYNKEVQDKMGYQLLVERPAIKNYIQGLNEDTKENVEKASLEVAKIWSSVGVPYAVQGSKQLVQKDQSFYYGGGDVASEPSSKVIEALKVLRNNKKNVFEDTKNSGENKTKTIFFVALLVIAGYVILTETKEGRGLLAKLK
jgi:muramidase (phage lysozyme)